MGCCNVKTNHFDLIIIGGGSAGFSAAIAAEQLRLQSMLINGGLDFGGTCVNIGCVPSKFLIRAAESAYHASHSPFTGIQPNGATIHFPQIIQEKKKLVAELRQKKYFDVVHDFKHLTLLKGWAQFIDERTILVDGKTEYSADKFLIATGASPQIPAIQGIEHIDFLTSASLFDLEEQPESLTILGAGYIGLEVASAYNRLGTKVRIIEAADRVLKSLTPDISQVIEKQLTEEGVEVIKGYQIIKFEREGKQIIIHCEASDGTQVQFVETGKLFLAAGTRPNTMHLGLEKIGITLTSTGHVQVNKRMESTLPHIYAAGDCADTPAFVYTAAHEAKIAVQNAFTNANQSIDYRALPWVIFTSPQIAGVGIDETQAAAQNSPFEVSKIELADVPKAITSKQTQGFIKLIRNPQTDTLLGARVVAHEGGELIQLLSIVMRYQIPLKEIAEGLFPYLTLSEGIKLAAIGFYKDVKKLSCCAS